MNDASSSTLTDSDSTMPPTPPNTPEDNRSNYPPGDEMQQITSRLNEVIGALIQFNNNHPTLPTNPRRSERNVQRPKTYNYTGRAYRQDRSK